MRPFQADPEALRQALASEDGRGQAEDNIKEWQAEQHETYQGLLGQIEEGSIQHREVTQAWRERNRLLESTNEMLRAFGPKIRSGSLTTDDIERRLNLMREWGINPDDALAIIAGQGPSMYADGTIDGLMNQRVQRALEKSKADGDEAGEELPMDIRLVRAGMEQNSENNARRRDNGAVQNLDEYTQLTAEMNAIASAMQGLRDPANRLGMNKQQTADLQRMIRQLDTDAQQAQSFFTWLDAHDIDSTPFREQLVGQLDRFEMGQQLFGDNAGLDAAGLQKVNDAFRAWSEARQNNQPAEAESVTLLDGVGKMLGANEANPQTHSMLAGIVERIMVEQTAVNGGTVPDKIRAALENPVFQRYGAFSDILSRLDMEDLMVETEGNPASMLQATRGQYNVVEWEPEETGLDQALVVDDRRTAKNIEADVVFREDMESLSPNVAAALNSLFAAHGGGIHRTYNDISEVDHPTGDRWRSAGGWQRTSGEDRREANQVGGVYNKTSNLVVVADSVLGRGNTSVVHHELGHALDSMLGETLADGVWFTDVDTGFRDFHSKLKKTAQYGPTADDSIMYWYYRHEDEGATLHNGVNGDKEVWAEGYAAYNYGRKYFAEMEGAGGPITQDTGYVLIARALTGQEGQKAIETGKQRIQQIRAREVEMGKLIYEFFDDLENNRLPELMQSGPKPIAVNSPMRNSIVDISGGELGTVTPIQQRATPEEKRKADTHLSKAHGLIQMKHVERGSPEWDQMEAAIKEASPGAGLPSPTALYVTWNPEFATQGNSVIWKAVMPNRIDNPTTEYTDEHKKTQLAAKFQRQQRVNSALDEAHAKAEAEAEYDETAALVLALIETGMRVGSSEKAGSVNRKTGKRESTFGGATMQAKHVFFPSETLMRFKFPGKSGKENVYESRNPVLRAAVKQLIAGKKPSEQVFANTNSGRTIDYIRTATGIDDIINHDTRTRFATNMARELVGKWPKSRMPKNEAAFKKTQSEVAKKVGTAINDTWTVARDSYISPAVWQPFEDSAGLPHSFDDSPPYGLIEGETVTELVPDTSGDQAPTETGPPAPAGPVAAAGTWTANAWRMAHDFATDPQDVEEPVDEEPMEEQTSGDAEPQSYSLDQSPEAVAERQAWYASFAWPEPPVVAGPDTAADEEEPSDGGAAAPAADADVPEAPAAEA